jgi:hypothetical protein
MEIVHKTSKALYDKTSTVRWPISDFFVHVNGHTKYLDSDEFSLDGSSSELFLRVYMLGSPANHLSYYMKVGEIASEKSLELDFKFWMENCDGEKVWETSGKLLLIKNYITFIFRQKGDIAGKWSI